jgi:hypothetical protein
VPGKIAGFLFPIGADYYFDPVEKVIWEFERNKGRVRRV